jgi:putative two-component system response regulator
MNMNADCGGAPLMHETGIDTDTQPPVDRRSGPRTDPTQRAHHDAIYTLARAAELHDEDTGNHVVRIRLIVERLAGQMGFACTDAEALGYDAMLHDVGKLTTPHDVLKKPGKLTDDERGVMESHTSLGERLLSSRPSMQRAARIARSHHECWDGSGYPDALRGEAIPLEARITAAADVLDALVADRCYKESWSYRQALEEVCALAGTKLDPDVVAALRRCDEQGNLRDIFRPAAYADDPAGSSDDHGHLTDEGAA